MIYPTTTTHDSTRRFDYLCHFTTVIDDVVQLNSDILNGSFHFSLFTYEFANEFLRKTKHQ